MCECVCACMCAHSVHEASSRLSLLNPEPSPTQGKRVPRTETGKNWKDVAKSRIMSQAQRHLGTTLAGKLSPLLGLVYE